MLILALAVGPAAMKPHRLSFFRIGIFATLVMWVRPSWAERGIETHVRAGLISGSYIRTALGGGESVDELFLPNLIELDFESFQNNSWSFFFRFSLGMDLGARRTQYISAGVGQRFYLFSKGMSFEVQEGAFSVSAQPRIRFYAGWDGGLTQVSFALAQQGVAEIAGTLVEAGAHIGSSYRISGNVHLHLLAAYGMGFGFSSVTFNSRVFRGLLGISYYQ